MSIIIHQSLYGDLDGGHGLLKTTMPDSKMAKKMGNSTDLSDRPAPGLAWRPAVRGFKFGAYYLIMKTYNTPEYRLGRVFSHVLVIENRDLTAIQDLSQLFALFSDTLKVDVELKPYLYVNKKTFELDSDDARIRIAADGLTKGKSVVWIGQDGFEQALQTIWANLWYKAKMSMQFGIQFNPAAVTSADINFFCTPDALAVKWHEAEYLAVTKSEQNKPISLAAKYILNREHAPTLQSFLSDIGSEPANLRQLALIEKGLDTYIKLLNIADFNELFSLYNILITVNTDNKKLLEKVIGQIADVIPESGVQAINALRKVKLPAGAAEPVLKLRSNLKEWVTKNLFSLSHSGATDVYKLIINIKKSDSEKWWSDLVLLSLNNHIGNWKKGLGTMLWMWIDADVENVMAVLDNIILTRKNLLGNDLPLSIPKIIKAETSDYLIAFSKKHSLLLLHAALLIKTCNVQQIIPEQLKVDTDKAYNNALLYISTAIKAEDFVGSTLIENDIRLEYISGKLINKTKGLLKDFNASNLVWQRILLNADLKSSEIKTYFAKPYSTLIYPLLDSVLSETSVQPGLLDFIAESEFANIIHYEHRKDIWKFFDPSVKNKFLDATALGILDNPTILSEEIEEELNSAVTSKKVVSAYLEKYKNDISQVLQFFNSRNNFPEQYLQDYLYYFRGTLNSVEAAQLGKLILTKNWKNCLGIVKDRARVNANYKVAFQECTTMLGWVAYGQAVVQGLISKVEINEDDWWEEFEQLAPRLYPEGPTDKKVWKKSSGEEADLLHKGDGREIWKDAISKLKFGRISHTFLGLLLDRMYKDFPYNEQLKILINLRNKI